MIKVDRPLTVARAATVWAALRPEKIAMSREPPAGLSEVNPETENVTRGRVRGIAYLGDASVYLVALDSGREVRVTLPNSARDTERRIARDELVYLSWQPGSPVVLTE